MNLKIQKKFKVTLVKGLMVLMLGMGSLFSSGQPTQVEGTWIDGGGYNNNIGTLSDRGTHRFYRNLTSGTSGTRTLLFNNPSDNYNPKWVADNATSLSKNSLLNNGAKYYTSGGTDINFAVTSGSYYTLIIGENTSSNNNLSILETTYNPTNFTSVSQSPLSSAVYAGESVTVSAVMAATLNSGEFLYLRYSTDGFSTSTVIAMSFSSGTTYTASIPTLTSGTVSYYLYTSNQGSAPTASESDFYSLNIYNSSGQNPNLGTNYSYTVNTWATVIGASNWTTAASWNANKVPSTTNSLGAVSIGHSITLDQAATVSSLTITAGTFTASDNSPRTLTITKSALGNSTTLANSGTWANGVGGSTVTFTGAPSSGDAIHNVTGTIAFRNVVINKTSGSSNVGVFFNTGQTLTNSIEIGTGGYVSEDVANFYGSSTTLIFNQGTGANYNVNNLDNTWPNSNPAPNITVSSGTVTLNTARYVTAGGTLTVASGATLASGGNLTIRSDATGTANIANSAGTISGNVSVERYISSSGRRWRFLSSPVQTRTVANWRSQFAITGPGANNDAVVGNLNANGWHQTYNNITNSTDATSTSVRSYVEASSTSGNLNLGWTDVTTATALTAGQGFRAFIRGPISGVTTQLGVNGNSTAQDAVTLSLTGVINSGDITPPAASRTYGGAGRGWNLLGNPYPCAYNFNAHYDANIGAEIANVNPTVYVYNSTGGTPGYVSYNASSNTNAGLDGGIIPSGTGFFIEASSTPTFVFKETYKTTTAPVSLHKTDISNVEFGIKYSKDTLQGDYMVVKMFDGATLNSELYDIKKLKNDDLNLSAYGEDTIQLTASCIPFITEETRIKLNVEALEIGTYKFDFTNMDNFDKGVSVSLFDRYTNKTTDVKANTKYTFEMGAGMNQWGKNRFELILNGKATTAVNNTTANSTSNTKISVYPNPATDELNINISNANFKNSEVVVYNISGTEILKTNMAANNAQLNIETLSNGVYFVKVTNQNGFNKTVKFVK